MLDEPLRNLRSKDKLERAYDFINELSEQLELQILLISHDSEFDNKYIVKMEKLYE
jgi:DNA repair exonuclease SbcCD ATPase subunit